VTDKNNKNQDLNPDQIPNSNPNLEMNLISNAEEEENLLLDVDSILNEEDPDFLKQLNKINIDPAEVDPSGMGKVFGLESNYYQSSLVTTLKRPFEFKTNTKQTLLFWLLFIVVAIIIKIIWNFQDRILHQNLFLNSLAELGSDLIDYNPNTEIEPFYDNPRFAKNLVTISPMHVNLKSSENSGDNPMLAIEITVEGLSPDAIIEIKDREAEFKDLLLRHTEGKTYDELVEVAGKQTLCEQYRDLLNSLLTQGQVRRVLLKSFIIKP
jgi:flagellar basal body-associated protein FliL